MGRRLKDYFKDPSGSYDTVSIVLGLLAILLLIWQVILILTLQFNLPEPNVTWEISNVSSRVCLGEDLIYTAAVTFHEDVVINRVFHPVVNVETGSTVMYFPTTVPEGTVRLAGETSPTLEFMHDITGLAPGRYSARLAMLISGQSPAFRVINFEVVDC